MEGNGGVVERSMGGGDMRSFLKVEKAPGIGGVIGLYSSGGGGVHGTS